VKRVAVTGSSGFIGRATVARLRELHADVVLIDRHSGIDVTDRAAMVAELIGCDSVVHLAGVLGTAELFDSIDRAIATNLVGSLNVLTAAHKNDARYVGITMPDCWPSVYQATKLAATRLAEAFHNTTAMHVVHLRTFNVYGPGQAHGNGHPQKILPTFAAQSWRHEPMPIWGDGLQTVDLVHVDHVANCLATAALRPDLFTPGQTYDVGSGVETSVLDVARMVGAVTGSHEVEHLPMRAGELPGTKLAATHPGPLRFDEFDGLRFDAAVRSYKCSG
jgi:UDP-glucose 4-epimerase